MSDNINNMDFKQLRNEVQLLRDELAIFKRKYEDIIYNLDDDNFSSRIVKQKGDMMTSIEQTEESIKLQAEKVTENSQNISSLEVTANQIQATVEENYDDLSSSISSVSVTASGVKSTVSSMFKQITKVNSKSDMTDKSKIYTYNDVNYHYNNIAGRWDAIEGKSIASSFIQTSSGFELNGDVKISGDLISGGTITGAALCNAEGTHELLMSEDNDNLYGTFRLYNQYSSLPYFGIYDDTLGTIGFKAAGGVPFLSAKVSGGVTVKPYGTWDFSNATVDGVGGGIAKFG